MTSSGCVSWTRERICAALSTPVVPSTPVRHSAVDVKGSNPSHRGALEMARDKYAARREGA